MRKIFYMWSPMVVKHLVIPYLETKNADFRCFLVLYSKAWEKPKTCVNKRKYGKSKTGCLSGLLNSFKQELFSASESRIVFEPFW